MEKKSAMTPASTPSVELVKGMARLPEYTNSQERVVEFAVTRAYPVCKSLSWVARKGTLEVWCV
jgi:hypothetical protein